MPTRLERKELKATLVVDGCPPMALPPIRPKGCSLEFWGGAVAIDRSLRAWDVGHAKGDTSAYASPAAKHSEMSPEDRRALADYMVDLWRRFGELN